MECINKTSYLAQKPIKIGLHIYGLWCVFAVVIVAIAACSDIDESNPKTTFNNITASSNPVSSNFSTGKVIKVVDGITIDVELDSKIMRVRYLGIDIPDPKSSLYSVSIVDRALQYNKFLVQNKTVEMEMGVSDKDLHGRNIRYVYVNGEMVNKSLLTNGYAVVADFPINMRDKTSFDIAEENAKLEQRGIWKPLKPNNHITPISPQKPAKSFGTLPIPPATKATAVKCDYSETSNAVINGNVDVNTKQRLYHIPSGLLYSVTEINTENGDKWFCTEKEALAAGWEKSKH